MKKIKAIIITNSLIAHEIAYQLAETKTYEWQDYSNEEFNFYAIFFESEEDAKDILQQIKEEFEDMKYEKVYTNPRYLKYRNLDDKLLFVDLIDQ